MMATRLSDSELAARIRTSNRQRAARQHERLRTAGKVQLNIWLATDVKAALATAAATNGETVSQAAERLLSAGLAEPNATRDEKPATSRCWECAAEMPEGMESEPFCSDCIPTTVYTVGVSDKAELMNEVAVMLEEGLSGNEIARRLNASGRRTAAGTEFIGANLLRDYRAWAKKAGADRTTAPNLCTQGGADFG